MWLQIQVGSGLNSSGTPHLSYDHVYDFKRKHLSEPPFGIPREEMFASEEQEKKINLKRHHVLYRGLQEVTIQKGCV